MERADIRQLEGITDRAWPAREVERGDGWEARAADGMHRRLNSASVWQTSDPAATVGHIERWYAARRLTPIFKLTDASPPGLEPCLEGRGYERDALVAVMTADLDRLPEVAPRHPVDLATGPSTPWTEAFGRISGYGPDRRRLLGAILRRIALPTAYAAVQRRGATVAVGMAVAEGSHAGVFEMATDPEHRGEGLAAAVMFALLGWMRDRAATTAYLQVLDGNAPAESLYRGAGFSTRYHYWYRVRPGGLSTMPR